MCIRNLRADSSMQKLPGGMNLKYQVMLETGSLIGTRQHLAFVKQNTFIMAAHYCSQYRRYL